MRCCFRNRHVARSCREAKLLSDEAASLKTGFRFGWPLIRLGTDLTLKVGTAASQYLLAIGCVLQRDAREMRFAAGAQCKTIAGAPRGSARHFSRWMGSRGVTHSFLNGRNCR